MIFQEPDTDEREKKCRLFYPIARAVSIHPAPRNRANFPRFFKNCRPFSRPPLWHWLFPSLEATWLHWPNHQFCFDSMSHFPSRVFVTRGCGGNQQTDCSTMCWGVATTPDLVLSSLPLHKQNSNAGGNPWGILKMSTCSKGANCPTFRQAQNFGAGQRKIAGPYKASTVRYELSPVTKPLCINALIELKARQRQGDWAKRTRARRLGTHSSRVWRVRA